MRAEDEKGSSISEEEETETEGMSRSAVGEGEKGCEERRRIAWVMVG